jgi:serine/threonine-protein kinase
MAYYGLIPPKEGFPRSRAAAEKALSLDPDLAEAHGTLGLGSLFHQRNWEDAERHFRRSIELNPKVASVHAFHAILLATLGRHDESIAEARTAHELDPLSPLINMSVGWAHYFGGQPHQAIAELLATRDLFHEQNADEVHSLLMVSYEQLGQLEDAARSATGSACFGVPIDGDALLAAWRAGGATGYWLERLAAIDRLGPSALPMAHYSYAVALTFLSRCDEAMAHLTALADNEHGSLVFLAIDPAFAPLRDRPDFDALLTRIGVPRPPTASAPHTA